MNRERNWHSLETADLERIFRTDGAKGLSDKEAERRLRHGKNTVWEVKTASVKRYAVRSLFDLTTVLLVLAVFAAAFFGSAKAALAIFAMLIIGRAARIATHVWAERVFEKNAKESLPRAKVVRGGTVKVVDSESVAPGDVIILDTGDTVPCDIRLTAADNILVSEENVTGVKGVVSKSSHTIPPAGGEVPITMRTNTLYASSVVISGFAIGIAVATGDDTLRCAREGRITLAGEKDVSTVEKLSDWGRICSLCLIGAALVITVIGILIGGSGLFEVFLPSIAMAAAGLSEFIAAVGAFAWAVKLREDESGVLAKSSIAEKAANTDLMVLKGIGVVKSGKTSLHSFYQNGRLTLMGTKGAKAPQRLLRLACYCTGASPEGGIVQGNFGTRHRASDALSYRVVRSLWEDNGKGNAAPNTYQIISHMPASDIDSRGLDNVLLLQGRDVYFAAMGNVFAILNMSAYVRRGNEIVNLTADEKNKIEAYARELAKHGVTLCAVGLRKSPCDNLRRVSVLHSKLCFEGFIAVADRPAEGVIASIEDMRGVGTRFVIFSDKGEEDKLYAEAEGIFKTGDLYLSEKECKEIKALSPEKGSLTVIETPRGAEGIRERLRLMKLIRENELFVSYVGGGIEDMWNMKNADISFAVGESGAIPQGIRTEAHGIVNSEGGGFDGVCRLIDKCRRSLLNIRSTLNYLITSQVARLVAMLLCAAAGLALPSAASLVLWGVILDFAVSFATATVPGEKKRARIRSGHISGTPDSSQEVLLPTMYGAALAVLSIAVPFVAKALASFGGFAPRLTDASIMTSSVASCIIAMPFIGAEYAGGYGLFSKKSKLSIFYIVPFAVSLISALLILFVPAVQEAFGAEFPGWIMTAFTLLPMAIIVAVMSVVRAGHNNKKEDKTSRL